MTTWYGVDTPEAITRLRGAAAWKDAPVEDLDTLSLILEIAKEQVLRYAAEPGEQEGEMTLGPTTLYRRNLARDPHAVGPDTDSARWRAATQGVVTTGVTGPDGRTNWASLLRDTATNTIFRTQIATGIPVAGLPFSFSFLAHNPNAAPVPLLTDWSDVVSANGTTVLAPGETRTVGLNGQQRATATAQRWVDVTNLTQGSPILVNDLIIEQAATVGRFFDGNSAPLDLDARTLSHAWEGSENASSSVETYRPFVFVPQYPARLVYAQLLQAKTLYNAGRVDSAGEVGDGGFVYTPRPLDWMVKQVIRPQDGGPDVL